MKDVNKVGTACGFGSLVGTIVALQFRHSWWLTLLGLVVGGLVGYLTYEFKKVLMVISKSWNDVMKFRIGICLANLKIVVLYSLGFPLSIGLIFLFLFTLNGSKAQTIDGLWITAGVWIMAMALSIFMDTDYNKAKLFAKKLNPISVLYFSIKYSLLGIWWVVSRIPTFIWNVFILIHSEKRIICFVDSALGTIVGIAVGYYTNTINTACVAGAISGYLLGIINYQIVSVRWLKLQPV